MYAGWSPSDRLQSWVVEGLAVEGALTLLTGKPGEGKSLLASALAAGVVASEIAITDGGKDEKSAL